MINGQRDGGCSRRTITGNPPLRRTAFWAISASVWREVMWRSAQIYFREKLNHKSKTNSIPEPILLNRESQSSGSTCFKLDFITILTAGSVISSRSPAWMTVRTRASIPPTWQTTVLLRWLLHVKLDRIPAAQVTTLTSLEPSSCTRAWRRPSRPSCCCGMSKGTKQAKNIPPWEASRFFSIQFPSQSDHPMQVSLLAEKEQGQQPKYQPTCFVAASDKLRQVHRQFWTRRWLWWPKCIARACIPPASTMAGLLLEQTDKTIKFKFR